MKYISSYEFFFLFYVYLDNFSQIYVLALGFTTHACAWYLRRKYKFSTTVKYR